MSSAQVTPVEIARLAGVGRAAVSNWRRRHPDFPAPVGGPAATPLFDLAEVEGWLRRHGRTVDVSESAWQHLRAAVDAETGQALVGAVLRAGRHLWGDDAAAAGGDGDPSGPLPAAARAALDACATATGRRAVLEYLVERLHETLRLPRIPEPVAALMARLLGPRPERVYDPTCGTGTLLLAVLERHPGTRLVGGEPDPAVRALARLRAVACRRDAGAPTGDGTPDGGDLWHPGGLDQPPDPTVTADAVISAPVDPGRGWLPGDPYDPRWAYGVPPRTEPELALVQHALASLRPGGRAVLLLPSAVASRPAGRRIRAELLRRGALRAVVGLPTAAVPGHSTAHAPGVHLWVLRRPGADGDPGPGADHVVIVDCRITDPADLTRLTDTVADLVEHPETAPPGARRPDPSDLPDQVRARVFAVIDLLDETTDVSPARRLLADPEPVDGAAVVEVRDRLRDDLRRLADLLPAVGPAPGLGGLPMIQIGDLVHSGALTVTLRQLGRGDTDAVDGPTLPLWRARDVLAGHGPTGRAAAEPADDLVTVEEGDVVAPAVGHRFTARVVTAAEAGAALGPNLYRLRPDPSALDPWFLAGFLRREGNTHHAGTIGSLHRYDVRRAQVPRIPVEEQRRYGRLFRQLAEFEQLLRRTAEEGDRLGRLVADGLAAGTLRPA